MGVGWTSYPPLATSLTLSPITLRLLIHALLYLGLSSTLTGTNLLSTILLWRHIQLRAYQLTLYNWSISTISWLMILVLPILTCSLLMILLDILTNTSYYD